MQYNFKVVNDNMVCDKREMPLTGNVNTYRCVFDIECDIENLLWFCVFERDGKAYVQPILENECFIPHEVLVIEGKIKIGCYATNLKEDDFKRISTNWVFFNSLEGAYSDAAMPEVPEPDVWEELVLKSVPIIGENVNWFIYDITKMQYVDSGVKASGKDGEPGYTPVKGVDYFTEADIVEIEEYLKETWDELVNVTLTENLATEFRHVFEKKYKRLRFKIIFKGQTALNSVRFKRNKTDGGNSPTANNYLKFSSGNTSTPRYLSATVSYDLDGRIILTNGAETNGTSGFGDKGGATFGGDFYPYEEKYRTFSEFFFYLGGSIAEDGTLSGNVLGAGTTIQVWGCEK